MNEKFYKYYDKNCFKIILESLLECSWRSLLLWKFVFSVFGLLNSTLQKIPESGLPENSLWISGKLNSLTKSYASRHHLVVKHIQRFRTIISNIFTLFPIHGSHLRFYGFFHSWQNLEGFFILKRNSFSPAESNIMLKFTVEI